MIINFLIPAAHAQASIPLPTSFATSVAAQAAQTITDLNPYTLLIVGVILATLIISIIIDALKK